MFFIVSVGRIEINAIKKIFFQVHICHSQQYEDVPKELQDFSPDITNVGVNRELNVDTSCVSNMLEKKVVSGESKPTLSDQNPVIKEEVDFIGSGPTSSHMGIIKNKELITEEQGSEQHIDKANKIMMTQTLKEKYSCLLYTSRCV